MVNQAKNGPAKATNPASSGPAGSEFEAQVGATYLLAMLLAAEPLGLPGMAVDSVELQRAGEGFPLDDVIIHAHNAAGEPAILEIQVKRSISFTPSDDIFRSVVAQISVAARKPGFWDSKHEVAVATARTSRKVDGAYQDVLTWARQLGSAATFADRISRKGSANGDMRTFVDTFRGHLSELGFPHDDDTIWKLLRRFHILVFDFAATTSVSEALARERSARALDPSESVRGGELWGALTGVALNIAASGGDRTRESLRNEEALSSFRWAGDPCHLRALAALAENGAAALADIQDQIGAVSISRPARIAEVHARLDHGRYVEIRGNAGVGKSGILKHFASQVATSSGIIVLRPGRIAPRGWTAFRAHLGFDGAARDLLVELAAEGMGVLFVDNLDLFTPEERTTVNDLLRAAATVPGYSVIATARPDFGREETPWLASDALNQLGCTAPIAVGELDDTEVEELIAAAPSLAGLLSSTHPARDVTRNLFRLARLASRPQDAPILRTEVDMAEEWWTTADGPQQGRRDRERVLRFLSEQAFEPVATFDVSSQPASAVDSLVHSETLRDYGSDRVGFRHDVLREWAIAKIVDIDGTAIDRLPLNGPASALLARGIELHARSLIESASDDIAWSSLLVRLTGSGIHGSWRRAALLALVRTEASSEALAKASARLLENGGAMLRELIRTAMAVDVQSAREMFAGSGIDVSLLPESFVVPSGPSWSRLIVWILKLGDQLPDACIPDVVDLFSGWSMAMLGADPLTPRLLGRLHTWLTAIEASKDVLHLRDRPLLFGGMFNSDQVRALDVDLRQGFVSFANRVPELAADYLRAAKGRREREGIAASLLEFRGTIAAAAPAELADLFEATLIPEPPEDDELPRSRRVHDDKVFTFFDSKFLPVSPAQGPFYELLMTQPKIGKNLIRRLVDYAIAAQTRGFNGEPDAIEIVTLDGVRRFPWLYTFQWSREKGARHFALSSGLMALEGWAHQRIEAGEPVEKVIGDVLGEGDAPAAYLQLVIDLILSHWPSSREAAIPYMGNPQLLILDRERQTAESIEIPDIFGLKELQREPKGPITAKSLEDRPSRQRNLYEHLKYYTFAKDAAQRERLVALLQGEAEALGAPTPEANYGNPEFMVRHALNQLDPANWQPVQAEFQDGTVHEVQQYVPPKAEADHVAPFQADAQKSMLDTQIQQFAATALEDPTRSNPQVAQILVDWAMLQPLTDFVEVEGQERDVTAWALGEAITNIAMVAMRDGDEDLRKRSRDWAHEILRNRLQQPADLTAGTLKRLQFNPLAIAFAGLAFSLRDRVEGRDFRELLEIASHTSAAPSHGFAVSALAIAAIDERLLKSVMRCALRARIYCHRDWELDEEVHEAQKTALRQKVDAGIAQELDWIAGKGAEPDWPEFPLKNPSPRRGIRLGGTPTPPRPRRRRDDKHADSAGSAQWLEALRQVTDVAQRPWLQDLIEAYRRWTCEANGGSLEDGEEVERPPTEWNDAYFYLMAACLPGLTAVEVDSFALVPICSLPVNAFLDVSAPFLRSADVVYLDADGIDPSVAAHIRQRFADHIRQQYAWERFARDRSASVEMHMGDAISAFCFHTYSMGFAPPKCYLVPDLAAKVHLLLPALQVLATEAPTLLIATETMSLLEVAPHPAQLTFAIAVVKAWAAARPDDTSFWVDFSIGPRFCRWLERIREQQPSAFASGSPERTDIDDILAALVRTGVAEAGSLESSLAGV